MFTECINIQQFKYTPQKLKINNITSITNVEGETKK